MTIKAVTINNKSGDYKSGNYRSVNYRSGNYAVTIEAVTIEARISLVYKKKALYTNHYIINTMNLINKHVIMKMYRAQLPSVRCANGKYQAI